MLAGPTTMQHSLALTAPNLVIAGSVAVSVPIKYVDCFNMKHYLVCKLANPLISCFSDFLFGAFQCSNQLLSSVLIITPCLWQCKPLKKVGLYKRAVMEAFVLLVCKYDYFCPLSVQGADTNTRTTNDTK